MKKYISGLVLANMLLVSSCADKLEVTPPNAITDKQISELLASGDTEKINLIMGGLANKLPEMFNYGSSGSLNVYDFSQGLDVMRSLIGNDMILGDQTGLSALMGTGEYELGDFTSAESEKNFAYWKYAWACITTANQMLNYLTDEVVGSNATLKNYKAAGLVTRAWGYSILMENYQDAYLQGGSSKLGIMLYDRFEPTQPNKARATSEETYAFIKNDLTTAVRLMKEGKLGVTKGVTRDIDLGVANFLLTRVSVCTGDWTTAISAADEVLKEFPTLMSEAQYGGKNTGTATAPVYKPETNGFLNNAANPEVILGFPLGEALTNFTAYMNPFGPGHGGLSRGYKRIDNRLYEKIADADYRQDVFSKEPLGDYLYPSANTVAYIPSYTNTKFAATLGIGAANGTQPINTTSQSMRASEVLLMKAEAQAKSGNEAGAKATLNILLAARTRSGAEVLTVDTYPSMQGLSALEMVQLQTRIEMWGETGREFYNNKRWNIPVNRTSSSNHVTKSSLPVSGMTLQIPENEMFYNPLIKQN